MGKNKINIEKLYKQQFEGFSLEPSHTVWPVIERNLFWKKFLSFSLNSFNIYYLLTGLAIPASVAVVLLTTRPGTAAGEQDTLQGQSQPAATDTAPAGDINQRIKTLDEHATYQNLHNIKEEKPDPQAQQKTKKQELIPKKRTEAVTGAPGEQIPGQASGIRKTETEGTEESRGTDESKREEETETRASTVAFSASALSGCAPLAVSFTNHSENAVSSLWSFGDGGTSTETGPSYVFDEAGKYEVRLQIEGKDGITRAETVEVTVHQTPSAVFEYDEGVDLSSGQPVYFYNYSRGADYFRWDFGDNQTSDLPDPVHYYSEPGSYDLKLRVWTADGCHDSMIVTNAFSDQGYEITFPTAFAPNPGGPTGGYYTENGTANEVFHPVVKGEIIEYQLKIFNQFGRLLFESNDINTGWDGYIQGEPMPQGVYIWKARGKFENGRTFVQSGDITLLRQR